MLECLYCFNYENLTDIVISYFKFNSKHHDKYTFVVKLTSLANTSKLCTLEVVQKYQHSQLCLLRENSNSLPHTGFTALAVILSFTQQWYLVSEYIMWLSDEKFD